MWSYVIFFFYDDHHFVGADEDAGLKTSLRDETFVIRVVRL